jgi:hypothetical protein
MHSGVEGLPRSFLFDDPAFQPIAGIIAEDGSDRRIFGLPYNDDLRRFGAYGRKLKVFTLAVSYAFDFISKSEAKLGSACGGGQLP